MLVGSSLKYRNYGAVVALFVFFLCGFCSAGFLIFESFYARLGVFLAGFLLSALLILAILRLVKSLSFFSGKNDYNTRLQLEQKLFLGEPKNIITLELDDYNKIANYYSNELNLIVLSSLLKECSKYARAYGFELERLTNTKYVLIIKDECSEHLLCGHAQALSVILKDHLVSYEGEYVNLCSTFGICKKQEGSLNKALMALEIARQRHLDYLLYDESLGLSHIVEKEKRSYKLIEDALESGRMVPFFQPIFNTAGKISKYETLARIIQPSGEAILPGVFLEYSRQFKRYEELSKMIFAKAFEELEKHENAVISINMSISDMINNSISSFVLKSIDEKHLEGRVVVEILENENLQPKDEERVKVYINELRARKVKIAVDDFGSGFSNFSLLLNIVPDYIKIDGEIVKNIAKEKQALLMVRAIVAFTHNLGAISVAEYVANEEIFAKCKELGVDEFQGFYLGEPSALMKDISLEF